LFCSTAGSCSPDNDDWKFFNDRCYYITGRAVPKGAASKLKVEGAQTWDVGSQLNAAPETSEFNWWDAEARCKVLGGNLVSIHSEAEQKFIEGQVVLKTFSFITSFLH